MTTRSTAKATPAKSQTTRLLMTPEKAAEFLALNTNNRRLSPRIVNQMAQVMAIGEWRFTHQSIAINRATNTLLDGQHRLQAVIQAGVAVEMLVTYLEEDVFDVIDTGKRRTAYDVLSMAGISHPSRMAPAMRLIMWYEALPFNKGVSLGSGGWKHPSIPNRMVLEFVQANPVLEELATYAERTSRELGRHGMLASLLAGYFLIDKHTTNSDVAFDEFHNRLADGLYLSEADPIATLRRWVSVQYQNQDRQNRAQMAVMMIIRSWSAYAEGRELSRLTWRQGRDFKPTIASATDTMNKRSE